MLHKLAKSHADNLNQKVEALKMQNEAIICSVSSTFYPSIVVAGTVCGETIDEYFQLDNSESIKACAEFTRKLTDYSKSLPLPMGDASSLVGAAWVINYQLVALM